MAGEFTALRELFADWLPTLPEFSDRLLQDGARTAAVSPAPFPALVCLGPITFNWKLQARRVSGAWRFLFWSRAGRGEDVLDAQLRLRLQPEPLIGDAALGLERPPLELYFPHLVIGAFEPGEFDRLTWPGAIPTRTVVLRIADDLTVSCFNEPTGGHDVPVERMRSVVHRGSDRLVFGREAPWPLDVLIALAEALGSPSARARGDQVAVGSFIPATDIQRSVADLTALARDAQWLLDRSARAPLPPGVAALQPRWRVAQLELDAGFFVSPDGDLAPTDPDDGLLVPIAIRLNGTGPQCRLELDIAPPQVAMEGERREALLASIVRRAGLREITEVLQRSLGDPAVTPELVRQWCEPDWPHAIVLLVDRRRAGRGDEYLLITTAVVRDREVAVLIHAERVTTAFDGRWTAEVRRTAIVFAGPIAGRVLPWNDGTEYFMDVIATLIRWRTLLPQ